MKIILLIILMILGGAVALLSYEFYTTTKINRFKFRYWFSYGILTMFHVALAIYFLATGDDSYQYARWATFALTDVILLEIFIYPMKHRRNELFVRVAFYLSSLLSPVILTAFFPLFNCTILFILAWHDRDSKLRKWFMVSFVLYALTTIVPTLAGFGTIASFLIGVVFMAHILIGVLRLYTLEKVADALMLSIKGSDMG